MFRADGSRTRFYPDGSRRVMQAAAAAVTQTQMSMPVSLQPHSFQPLVQTQMRTSEGLAGLLEERETLTKKSLRLNA